MVSRHCVELRPTLWDEERDDVWRKLRRLTTPRDAPTDPPALEQAIAALKEAIEEEAKLVRPVDAAVVAAATAKLQEHEKALHALFAARPFYIGKPAPAAGDRLAGATAVAWAAASGGASVRERFAAGDEDMASRRRRLRGLMPKVARR